MKKDIITKNFTRHSALYDQYCDVQRNVASMLLERLNGHSPKSILDIGCGTGWYTNQLSQKYPHAIIQAVDISPLMIEYAKEIHGTENIDFIVGDAEIIELQECFDLITSNSTFQWFSNLPAALAKFGDMLGNDGKFLCSIFGPNTYSELAAVIKTFVGDEVHIASCEFMDNYEILQNMEKSFSNVEIEHIIFREDHDDLFKLLKKIKYTGTRGMGINKELILNRGKLAEMEKIYIDMFGKIVATNEVFICTGSTIT